MAASVTKKPVAIILDREDDMQINGNRHSFLAKYTFAVNKVTQKILAMKVKLYSDGGWSRFESCCRNLTGFMKGSLRGCHGSRHVILGQWLPHPCS